MEKFAVDLEKVLNEFEYNEERRESGPATAVRAPQGNSGLSREQLPSMLPSAAMYYRKPPFERITLADADFAASPPKPSGRIYNNVLLNTPDEDVENFDFNNTPPQPINNKNFVNSTDSEESILDYDTEVLLKVSNSKQNPIISVRSDEKPDLLESNSTTAGVDSNDFKVHNQLPDLTTSMRNSAISINSFDSDHLSLDLISSANETLVSESNKSPILSDTQGCTLKPDSTLVVENSNCKVELGLDIPAINGHHNTVLISMEPSVQNILDRDFEGKTVNDREKNIVSEETVDVIKNQQDSVLLQAQTIDKIDKNTLPENEGTYVMKETHSSTSTEKVYLECAIPINENIDYQQHIYPDKSSNSNEFLIENSIKIVQDIKEHQTETLVLRNNIKDVNNKVKEILESPKVICFGYEDYSEGELLKYLDEVDEEFEDNSEEVLLKNLEEVVEEFKGTLVQEVPFHEEFLPFEDLNTSCNDDLPLISTQTDVAKEVPFLSNSISQELDNVNKSSTSKFSGLDYVKNDFSTIDYKNSLEQSTNSLVKQKSPKVENKDYTSNSDFQPVNVSSKHMLQSNEELSNSNELQITSIIETGFDNEENNLSKSTKHSPLAMSLNTENQDGACNSNTFYPVESESITQLDHPYSNKIKINNLSTNPFEEEENEESIVEPQAEKTSMNPFEDETNSSCQESGSESPSSVTNSLDCSRLVLGASTSTTNESSSVHTVGKSEMSFHDVVETPKKNTLFKIAKLETVSEESKSNTDSQSTLRCSANMIPIKQAVESSLDGQPVDEAGTPALEDRPSRPSSLDLPEKITIEPTHSSPDDTALTEGSESSSVVTDRRLGKIAPFWIPDADATMCMQCQMKFNVIKRRHHCRACGQVLCYKCCSLKAKLEHMDFEEARVCQPCFTILEAVSESEGASARGRRQPNPNNPMEYCSTIPPLQQVASVKSRPPPSVMVPVGVLKREGRNKSDVAKQVIFSDGIRPGGDLTELDGSAEPRMPFRRSSRLTKRVGTPPGGVMSPTMCRVMDASTQSFIPSEGDSSLPPTVTRRKGEVSYVDLESPVELNTPLVKFALNRNLFVSVKRVLLDCCVNRECWCFSSEGLACVGQDEIIFLLECLPQETFPPKDVFLLINFLYQDAAKGSTVGEMSFTPAMHNNLLGSRDHGGFLYIRTSFHCTAQLILPSPPFLVALLVHRWETPWARLFPIRLMMRLGAEFRYYPCPLVSVRNRPPLYTEIGQTIINILADFRKYSYTLPSVRGLVIHMEDRQTTISIPRNRYDQVVRALNNSNDSVLAFGANLSLDADSHLVCMQSSEDENTSYHTQAINIHNKPRKVTGASFVVFNGALKAAGLAGKSNIVEDGLMVQVPAETMVALRTALRDMKDFNVGCGPNAEETVLLQWTADDYNFNIGVKSCIDGKPLDGVPSIRVHNGTDYSGGMRLIRWTEVFILQCEDADHATEPLDISRLSDSIARATCLALVPLLDLLSAASLTTLAVRTTIHPDNVGYEAGSNGEKLPPLYMKSLDNELIAVVHQAALATHDSPAILELIFHIMEQG